jgi:hypothetical protein
MHRYQAIELNGVIDCGEILNPLVKSLNMNVEAESNRVSGSTWFKCLVQCVTSKFCCICTTSNDGLILENIGQTQRRESLGECQLALS